jgi:serine/threonine protein kinase
MHAFKCKLERQHVYQKYSEGPHVNLGEITSEWHRIGLLWCHELNCSGEPAFENIWTLRESLRLSSARVIDFSYSTPLKSERLSECPDILKGWLSGTIQFMAPEQADTVPFTSDFTKIDVWALGVLLINMLTLEFAFEGVH